MPPSMKRFEREDGEMLIQPLNERTRREARPRSPILGTGVILAAFVFTGCPTNRIVFSPTPTELEAELVPATGDPIARDYALSGSMVLPTETATSANYRLTAGIRTLVKAE